MSMPKSLRRSSPVASKPAWRGPPGERLDPAELDRQARTGRVTSPMVSSPSTVQPSRASVMRGRAERHRGSALDVEQVGGADVGVAVGVAGVDGREVDGRRRPRCRSSVVADDDVDVERAGSGRAPSTRRGGGSRSRRTEWFVSRAQRPGDEGEGARLRWWSWRHRAAVVRQPGRPGRSWYREGHASRSSARHHGAR